MLAGPPRTCIKSKSHQKNPHSHSSAYRGNEHLAVQRVLRRHVTILSVHAQIATRSSTTIICRAMRYSQECRFQHVVDVVGGPLLDGVASRMKQLYVRLTDVTVQLCSLSIIP